jgi:hypothetical protein
VTWHDVAKAASTSQREVMGAHRRPVGAAVAQAPVVLDQPKQHRTAEELTAPPRFAVVSLRMIILSIKRVNLETMEGRSS